MIISHSPQTPYGFPLPSHPAILPGAAKLRQQAIVAATAQLLPLDKGLTAVDDLTTSAEQSSLSLLPTPSAEDVKREVYRMRYRSRQKVSAREAARFMAPIAAGVAVAAAVAAKTVTLGALAAVAWPVAGVVALAAIAGPPVLRWLDDFLYGNATYERTVDIPGEVARTSVLAAAVTAAIAPGGGLGVALGIGAAGAAGVAVEHFGRRALKR